jgi:hypothetical protein
LETPERVVLDRVFDAPTSSEVSRFYLAAGFEPAARRLKCKVNFGQASLAVGGNSRKYMLERTGMTIE